MCKGQVAGGILVKDVVGEVGWDQGNAEPITHAQESYLYCKNKGKPEKEFFFKEDLLI